MKHEDIVIVGGGPAGATCAWRLRQAGLDPLVLDRARFPRDKVCAGWVTPAVLAALQLSPAAYGAEQVCQPFRGFVTGCIGGGPALTTSYGAPVSYGIRRREFDDYLLRRCGARCQAGEAVHRLRREAGRWVVNESFTAALLIGAGGHFCPVAKLVSGGVRPARVVLAQELEYELTPAAAAACPVQPELPELYFCPDLRGYGWLLRKGPCLNVGLGREDSADLPGHVAAFRDWLRARGRLPPDLPDVWPGHAYLLRGASPRPPVAAGALLLGDALGLAYARSGEGLRPAVESALLAAAVIVAARGDYSAERLQDYPRRLAARFGAARSEAARGGRLYAGAGRWLLAQPWFVRHLLLDRWFLHRWQAPLAE